MEQSEVGIKEADAVTLIVDVRTDYKSLITRLFVLMA